jgi:hypothetical protein
LKIKLLFGVNLLLLLSLSCMADAQMITGVWKGRINREKVEVKIIQDGDSIRGTSYYYESPTHYRRYSIKGYFNEATNEVMWWDDRLIDQRSGRYSLRSPGLHAMLSSADFNCPGDGRMMLDGRAGKKEDGRLRGDLHLDKVADPSFGDEWDFVIDNYTIGANDPYIIDSVDMIAYRPDDREEETPVIREPPVVSTPPPPPPRREPEPAVVVTAQPEMRPVPQTIEEKFETRKKVLVKEIPVKGDSVELRFYDNAEIDGDSISLFLNGRMIFSHIRLTGSAYTIRLPVSEMGESNELIMVAENLGSIPPNTSYMVAIVGEERYEARLESTEGSSAMIRFVKEP